MFPSSEGGRKIQAAVAYPLLIIVVGIATVVVLLAFFLVGPIVALHEANLKTGGIGGRDLPAPQAGLMAQLTKGIIGGEMAWGLLIIGAAFAVALLLCGARAMMLIAVGMYLPFDTSAAIFAGGVISWLASRLNASRTESERAGIAERGTLLASGLIAGEAIMGILLAVQFLAGIPSLARLVTGADSIPGFASWSPYSSLAAAAILAWTLIRLPLHARER